MGNFRGKIYKTLHLIIPYHMEMALIYGGLNISYTFGLESTIIRVSTQAKCTNSVEPP